MEGIDRVIAIFFTFIVIGVIAVSFIVLVASLIANPIGTVILLVVITWLFRRIYPYVVKFMKREGF